MTINEQVLAAKNRRKGRNQCLWYGSLCRSCRFLVPLPELVILMKLAMITFPSLRIGKQKLHWCPVAVCKTQILNFKRLFHAQVGHVRRGLTLFTGYPRSFLKWTNHMSDAFNEFSPNLGVRNEWVKILFKWCWLISLPFSRYTLFISSTLIFGMSHKCQNYKLNLNCNQELETSA